MYKVYSRHETEEVLSYHLKGAFHTLEEAEAYAALAPNREVHPSWEGPCP